MSGKSLNIGRYLLVGAALACIAHPAEGRTSLGGSASGVQETRLGAGEMIYVVVCPRL
jgi:hypothetical protein